MAVKNATLLLDDFCAAGIAIEVAHRSKRRLFGLTGLAPLRDVVRHRTGPSRAVAAAGHRWRPRMRSPCRRCRPYRRSIASRLITATSPTG